MFGKIIFIFIGILMEIFLTLFILFEVKISFVLMLVIYKLIGILVVFFIFRRSTVLSKDIPWIIIIMLFPIIGSILYFILGTELIKIQFFKNIDMSIRNSKKYFDGDKNIKREVRNNDYDILSYLFNNENFSITKNNKLKYYSSGEDFYKAIMLEIKRAKKFIFMEFLIISPGCMWDDILEALKEKVISGVEVRVIYDNIVSSRKHLEKKYYLELEKLGIKCEPFYKNNNIYGKIINHYDHRKILVVDGKVAFTGGINIGDEYINKKNPYGYWRDCGIMIEGDGVWNFTIMFLSTWNALRREDSDFKKYRYLYSDKVFDNGYVVSYGDNPFDKENVGKNVYLSIINNSKKELFIITPYLILDADIYNSLVLAVKRGVNVNIIIPGIPDSKIVYQVSLSYARDLIRENVNIYTYTPGFIHGKVFVSDNSVATVGTFNVDFRSVYSDFECGVFMQNCDIIREIKRDVLDIISKSHKLLKSEIQSNFFKWFWESLLRLLSPLM